MIDRLAIRTQPPGSPVMHQSWGKLLFMHWPVPVHLIRPLIPDRLSIDTYDGTAWIGISPLELWGARPALLPAIPRISETHELNVRTYVHLDGVPGVWFLSLDASNPLAVWFARLAFHLPYYRARMQLQETERMLQFSSIRTHRDAPPAEFKATWMVGDALPQHAPESLDFFLIERYCLYSSRGDQLFQARIFHRPWPLCSAELVSFFSTMLESHGLPGIAEPPLLHQQAEPLEVGVWPLQEV